LDSGPRSGWSRLPARNSRHYNRVTLERKSVNVNSFLHRIFRIVLNYFGNKTVKSITNLEWPTGSCDHVARGLTNVTLLGGTKKNAIDLRTVSTRTVFAAGFSLNTVVAQSNPLLSVRLLRIRSMALRISSSRSRSPLIAERRPPRHDPGLTRRSVHYERRDGRQTPRIWSRVRRNSFSIIPDYLRMCPSGAPVCSSGSFRLSQARIEEDIPEWEGVVPWYPVPGHHIKLFDLSSLLCRRSRAAGTPIRGRPHAAVGPRAGGAAGRNRGRG